MKRELVLQGMGWGHMPKYLVAPDLRKKRLIDITGRHLRGLIANRLWRYIEEQAPAFGKAVG